MSWNNFDTVILRGFLPIVLLAASVTRYCGFSFVYLLMLLICPLIRYDIENKKKPIQIYLIILLTLSGIFSLSIPVYQLKLFFQGNVSNCSNKVTLVMHQIGVINLKQVISYCIPRLVLPDYVILITSITLLIYFRKRTSNIRLASPISNLNSNNIEQPQIEIKNDNGVSDEECQQHQHEQQQLQHPLQHVQVADTASTELSEIQQSSSFNINNKTVTRKHGTAATSSPIAGGTTVIEMAQQQQQQQHNYLEETFGIHRLKKKIWRAWAMQSLFVFFNVVITGLGGIMSPSILNSIYLFSFLGVCTYWACGNKVITTNFAYMRIFLLMYSAIHVCLLYLVQIEFMQFYLPDGQFSSRLLGLYYLFDTRCSLGGEMTFKDQRIIDYLSPCVIIFVYYLYATETRRWFEKGRESVPRVRSLKEEAKLSGAKPLPSKDPELQQLIPDRDGSSSLTTTGSVNYNNNRLNYRTINQSSDLSATIPSQPPIRHQQLHQRMLSMPMVDIKNSHNSGKIRILNSHQLAMNSPPFIDESGDQMLEVNLVPPTHSERPLLLSLINTAIRNSYVFTFIAMMAWSVTYKSWMSFILLLSACILWMMPDSRRACLYMSPLIVFYATALIIIQYIYGFNVSQLPNVVTTSSGTKIDLTEIGLQKWEIPTKSLAMMIVFIVFFWLTLRLFMNERLSKTKDRSEQSFSDSPFDQVSNADSEAYFGDVDNVVYRKTISFLNAICQKYWILVCCFAMLVVSIQGPVVLFRIIYMGMLIYFQLTFMLSYSFWRKQMYVFWWVVIVYSVIVLLAIYTFQFQKFPYIWQNKTGLSTNILKDIGLQTYETAALFQGLLTPVVFLVVIIVQVRYFHKPFLKLSSMSRFQFGDIRESGRNQTNLNASTASTSTSNASAFIEDVNSAFQAIVNRLKIFFDNIYTKVWRFLEVHFTKIVAFLIMYACINEVNACNMVLIFILVVGVPFPKLHPFVVTFSFFWCSLLVLLKMVYQLQTIQSLTWKTNCTYSIVNGNSSTSNLTDNAQWIGLSKVTDFKDHISVWTAILVSCAIWHAVKYHQRQFFNAPGSVKPPRGVVFGEITAQTLDDSLLTLFKFFINYTFYKLGLELCFIITVIVACLRVDVYSVIYLVLLLVFLCTPRKICAKIWWIYLLLLGILLPIQYACCVGFPPGLCLPYPFQFPMSLQQWLYLPNYKDAPVAQKLMADFFQFIFVALQYQVFEIEKSTDVVKFGGGKNRPILSNELPKTFDKDFVSTKDSYVDYLKHAVFYWSYWLSLAIVFITGVFWITLFCLGYMILAFIYLWMGQNIMLRKRSNLIASWNVIIYYNFFVILAKCSLQLMGCVYMQEMISWSLCWIIQLFGVQCINPMSWNILLGNTAPADSKCLTVDSGLHWDVTCFLFIILQRKIFMTKSFCHVVLDLNVQNRFASRGAYLINKKMMATIREQKEKEENVLVKIQQKIDKIIQRQAQHGKPELNEHYLVMRSGDYYLFEGDPEEDDEEVDNLKYNSDGCTVNKRLQTFTTEDEYITSNDNNFLYDETKYKEPISDIVKPATSITSINDNTGPIYSSREFINVKDSADSKPKATLTNTDNDFKKSEQQPALPRNLSPSQSKYSGLNPIRENSMVSLDSNPINSNNAIPIGLKRTSDASIKQGTSNLPTTSGLNIVQSESQDHVIESGKASSTSSSDEDDANPNNSTGTHINPLQLINRAMEQGPRSAIREFKRTQSECRGDSSIGNSNRRSSVHLGSRLESMSALGLDRPGNRRKRRMTVDHPYSCQILRRSNAIIEEDMSEQDELNSLPEAYNTPPGSTVPLNIVNTGTSESNTEEDSFHSAAGASSNIQPLDPNILKNIGIATTNQQLTERAELAGYCVIEGKPDYYHPDEDDDDDTCIEPFPGEYAIGEAGDTRELLERDAEDNRSSKSNHPDSCWSKFKASIIIFYYFIRSTTDSIIFLLNGWTREARRISRTLDNEKRLVKRKVISKINNEINAQIELESIVMEIVGDKNANIASSKNQEEERKEQAFRRSRNRFFLLVIAIGNVAVVYSEFVCYFLLILNHMLSGNMFSLPYPLMVFLWAMLSVPRPSKNFWIALITYTEIVIVIKYIFQFKFIEFNSVVVHRIDPLSIPLILGIEKAKNYAILDLIQLLFIFLHRGYLKNNGLWRDHTEFAQDLEKVDEEQNARDVRRFKPSYDDMYQAAGRSINPFYKIKRFYSKMTNPKFNKKVDVYVFMFLCEFIAFLIIIFGYVSFGPGTDAADNAFDFIKTNKMPVPFVIMLMTQFVFFIIDRALFLRKQVKGKFVFQIFHVILIHAWLFFALPHITKKKFNSQIAPQLLYFIKCIYFALSAYQMKSGYPLRILGNFLTRDFNYLNLILFKGYMLVPFLYELRNVMDWMWTDTAVALYHWMEVEDVFCKIFVLKCWRRSELEYPTLRGHTRRLATKYTVGTLLLAFFFICFWGPLTLSSFIGTTFVKNPPVECTFKLDVGGYEPFYTFTSRANNLKDLSKVTYDKLKACYQYKPSATDYLQSFEIGDITEIHLDSVSANTWDISPPRLESLLTQLNSSQTQLKINMKAVCERRDVDAKSIEKVVSYTYSRKMEYQEQHNIATIIKGKSNPKYVDMKKIFPRYLTAYKRTLSKADALVDKNLTYLSVNMYMKRSPSTNRAVWWELKEYLLGDLTCPNKSKSKRIEDELVIMMFSERVSDNLFGHLFSNYGILGMYAAYIFVAHRVLRAFYSDISYIIRCEELPHVDRILNLLNEIYLVRENKMFRLEEQLIAKLIFLYRSSDTMIKWTRHKKSILEKHMESNNQQINNNNSVHRNSSNADDDDDNHNNGEGSSSITNQTITNQIKSNNNLTVT